MVLIGMGGANLINKGGHEILEDRNGESSNIARTNYITTANYTLIASSKNNKVSAC